MKAKKTKKLKGMTLVEVLVAMTVLGIGGMMLCTGFAQVSKMNAENYDFNQRMSDQIKLAENQESDTDRTADTTGDVTIKVVNSGKTYTISGKSTWIDTTDEDGHDKVDVDFKYFVPNPIP